MDDFANFGPTPSIGPDAEKFADLVDRPAELAELWTRSLQALRTADLNAKCCGAEPLSRRLVALDQKIDAVYSALCLANLVGAATVKQLLARLTRIEHALNRIVEAQERGEEWKQGRDPDDGEEAR